MPTKVLKNQTPLQCLKDCFPGTRLHSDIPLKVFGCIAYVHIPSQFRSKLDPSAIKCVFLGYASNKKGYKCYDPNTKKIYVSMDVSFLENQSFFDKNSLQEEKHEVKEDNFWNISVSLPNVIDSIPSQESLVKNRELESCSSLMPNVEVSQTGGEVLQNDHSNQQSELQVYARRKLNQRSKRPTVNPVQT